jgi:hypothetical protein
MTDISMKVGTLKDFLSAQLIVAPESFVLVRPKSLHCDLVDPAHVMMGVLHIEGGDYSATSDYDVCLDSERIMRCVKGADKDDTVNLHLDGQYCNVKINGLKMRRKLVQDVPTLKVPNLHMPNKISVPHEPIKRFCAQSADFGEGTTIKMVIGPEGLHLEAAGNDTESVELDIGAGESVSLKADELMFSKFPLDYFRPIIGIATDFIILELGQWTPARITSRSGIFSAQYLLAPQIDDEAIPVQDCAKVKQAVESDEEEQEPESEPKKKGRR